MRGEARVSRGLGAMQQAILDTLETAKLTAPRYRGCGQGWKRSGVGVPLGADPAGWIWYMGGCVQLGHGVYDLRCSSTYLRQQRTIGVWNSHRFFPAFSRAIKTLLARGVLTALHLVPLGRIDVDYPCDQVHFLSDGLYLSVQEHPVRFVSVKNETLTLREPLGDAPTRA
jgi:hypothetical protein